MQRALEVMKHRRGSNRTLWEHSKTIDCSWMSLYVQMMPAACLGIAAYVQAIDSMMRAGTDNQSPNQRNDVDPSRC